MADYILLIQMDIPAELEDDFNHYYNTQHVPNLLQVEGVHSCTRFRLETSSNEGLGMLRSHLRGGRAEHTRD